MSSTVVDAMIVVDDEDDNNFVPILGEKELTQVLLPPRTVANVTIEVDDEIFMMICVWMYYDAANDRDMYVLVS